MRSAILLAGISICFASALVDRVFGQAMAIFDPSKNVAPAPTPKPTPVPTKIGPKFKRWFDLDAANLITRYRYIGTNSGSGNTSQQQWQTLWRGHFQFDKKARYRVNWLVQSGPTITTGWNNTGLGTGQGQTNLFVKQLYFDAKPNKTVEFQIGGIDFNRGENTEAVTYDNDAYLSGERIAIRGPKSLYFDEISATVGFIGDFTHPSVFRRFRTDLDHWNYHQFLVRKQITKQLGFSADYTFQDGRDTLHEAVRVKDPKRLYFDTLLLETYQRLDPQRDAGINAYAEKIVNKHFTLGGGFARIDRRLTLNGDRFPPGKRLYITALFKIDPVWSVSVPFTEAIGKLPGSSSPRRRFEIVLTYNLLEDLKRHHIL
jgi:hypothetical protein